MSDILETESNAVITVKKTFGQFVKFYGLSSEKMLQVVYQSDLNKICQSNIKEYNGITRGAIY